ncbi:hypothetical protein ACJX0J_018252 [Zea mays]
MVNTRVRWRGWMECLLDLNGDYGEIAVDDRLRMIAFIYISILYIASIIFLYKNLYMFFHVNGAGKSILQTVLLFTVIITDDISSSLLQFRMKLKLHDAGASSLHWTPHLPSLWLAPLTKDDWIEFEDMFQGIDLYVHFDRLTGILSGSEIITWGEPVEFEDMFHKLGTNPNKQFPDFVSWWELGLSWELGQSHTYRENGVGKLALKPLAD